MNFQYPPVLGRNIEYTPTQHNCSRDSPGISLVRYSLRKQTLNLKSFLGILAHLLRMVMEPKFFAFRRWLYTPIILWRSLIGSLGHETWSNNMHVGTTPKMRRNCAIVPGEVTAMMFDGSELHLPIRNHKTTVNQDDPICCFTPF